MATATSTNKSGINSPPPPPRLTGTLSIDMVALREWIWAFYQATVIQSGLLDPAFQADPGTFDPNNLPSPSDTSIAKAQNTANHAFRDLPQILGQATLSDTNNTITFSFATAQANAKYSVIVQPVGFTGSPNSGAFIVIEIAKATASFTVTFDSSPGAGTSATYDLILIPSPVV